MLKTPNIKSAKLTKGKITIDSDSKSKVANNKFDNNEVNCNKVRDNEVIKEKNHHKTFKSKKMVRSSDYLTLRAS